MSSTVSKHQSLARIIVIFGILLGLMTYGRLWQIGDDGLSLVSKTTPYWDFNNLWTGGKLALQGSVDVLFTPAEYRAQMNDLTGATGTPQEWSYPPSILLFGAPLSILPLPVAYLLWTLGSLALLALAIRALKLPRWTALAILLSPAIFYNALYGQNGALIAALLVAGLTLVPKRPILAGILIGLLTIKPQFGILIPLMLIAGRHWRAFGAAAITSITMFLATGLLFGFSTWQSFMTDTQPMMRAIMEAPYMQPFQINGGTLFMAMRSFGAPLTASYAVQFSMTALCAVAASRLWQRGSETDHRIRIAISMVLIMLATPYGYSYDMVIIMAAIAIFYSLKPSLRLAPVFALAWLWPLINHVVTLQISLSMGAIVMMALLASMLINARGLLR